MKKKILFLITMLLCTFNCKVMAADISDLAPANSAFDDYKFYSCITNRLGVSSYTNVTDEQLANITSLSCNNKGITSVKGLEKLTGLTNLELYSNKLTNIDVSNNTALTRLNLYNNQLTSIDISNNTALTDLNLSYNQLTSIDVSNNTALTSLNLSSNQLTSIDVSNNTELDSLYVDEDVEVIGENENTYVRYSPLDYIFDESDVAFKNGIYEYTINVDNKYDTIAGCYNYSKDNALCSIMLLSFIVNSSSNVEIYFNDELFDLENFKIKMQEEFKTNPDLKKIDSGKSGSVSTTIDGKEVYFSKHGEQLIKYYIELFKLNVGNNVLKLVENGETYTINIIRAEDNTDNTATGNDLDNVIKDIAKEANIEVNDNVPNLLPTVQNEVAKGNPDTGIFLSIGLSLLSIGILGIMYYGYYRKKVEV